MNWLAWILGGPLLVTMWIVSLLAAALSGSFGFGGGGSEPPFRAVTVVFGTLLLAWLALGVAGAFGVYPRFTWGSFS